MPGPAAAGTTGVRPNGNDMNAKRIAIASLSLAGLTGAAVGLWLLFTHNVRASLSYCVEAEFGKMPADDVRLIEWLKVQPGIVPHTVNVRRFGPKEEELEVGFIQVRTLAGDPQFPNLDQQCAA